MVLIIPFLLVAYGVLYAFAFVVPPQPLLSGIEQSTLGGEILRDSSLESWLELEERIALDRLLANVAPGGRNVLDAALGSVIASPSRRRPNYYYQWVRDAAITMSTIVELYADDPFSSTSHDLLPILEAYASLQRKIQRTTNPSGTFSDLSGLGEPKFHADGTAFYGSWGRPQRDGPALRALTLMAYLRAYNASHPALWTSEEGDSWFKKLYQPAMPADSVIKADLEYVSHFWRNSGFDLWEEIQGLHFFTAMVQLRALREGAELAMAFGDLGAGEWYRLQASEMEAMVLKFWDGRKGHLIETLNGPRTGLDCGLLLGTIHGTTVNSTFEQFAPYSDEVLVSLLALVRDQSARFPINAAPKPPSLRGAAPLSGVGVGRYPEDVYDGYGTSPGGGNPWFLCTSSVSEIMYRTAEQLTLTRKLHVSLRGLPFWEALLISAPKEWRLEPDKTYGPLDEVFDAVVRRLKEVGDEFLAVVKTHTDAQGALSEQFDRVTGFERGAKDLTWSYGAFLQAIRARKRAG